MYRVLLLLAWGLAATAQAQTAATLTLACKGTVTSSLNSKPEPLSMGLIINFTTRTVHGFGVPGADYPLTITAANETMVTFSGQHKDTFSTESLGGSIDRVTGDLDATSSTYDEMAHKPLYRTTFSLQCRPAQRMF
jgi:hypothetical protein